MKRSPVYKIIYSEWRKKFDEDNSSFGGISNLSPPRPLGGATLLSLPVLVTTCPQGRACFQGYDALKTVQTEGDEGTADMLIGRIEVHDKNAWMLKSSL